MASTEGETDIKSTPQDIPARIPDESATASTPVEMNSLKKETSLTKAETHESENSTPQMPSGPSRVDTNTAIYQSQHPKDPPGSSPSPPVSPRDRTLSTAIGPSFDSPVPITKDTEASGPSVVLTLLLTNGARHPFKLDGKYLAKRNVQITDNDPFNLSVYKLKELILREWRDEWETKPSSPSSIRLISFGKLLDDKSALKDLRLNPETPNVIHMTIKPQDFIEEEDAKGGKSTHSQNRDGTEGRSPGCRCIVM